jgi:uncharacterized protein
MPADPHEAIDAGRFSDWLEAMRAVLRGERDAEVPCGDCVGCCVSSYPIPLRLGDKLARERVLEQWLIGPADADKSWLMGFREDGSCPFHDHGACSVYAGRPQTCRDYDCRIYAAAQLMPDGERPVIRDRVRTWRFALDSAADHAAADSVRRAAEFIRSNAGHFPAAMRTGSATSVAVLAVKTHVLFLDGTRAPGKDESLELAVQRVIQAARAFDAGVVGA